LKSNPSENELIVYPITVLLLHIIAFSLNLMTGNLKWLRIFYYPLSVWLVIKQELLIWLKI